jgi:Beta-amyloid precursor protein C-terminus
MAAVFVGVAVAKYRASRSPHAQGFVEVDQVRFFFLNLKQLTFA